MTSNEQGDQERRSGSADPTGGSTGYGQQYGQPSYGQQQEQSAAPQYGQQQYGQAAYDQPQYGQSPYGQQQYGQQQYGSYGEQYGSGGSSPAQYGGYGQQPQQQYGYQSGTAYGQYGGSAVPAKPAGVTIAAVLGFILGALGVLAILLAAFGGAFAGGTLDAFEAEFAAEGVSTDEAQAALGFVVALFVVPALIWTVLMIWGSVWSLTGRSRVLLIVGASIAIAFTGFLSILALSDLQNSGAGSTLFLLACLGASIAIVVLLARRPASDYFAAHRARRSGR